MIKKQEGMTLIEVLATLLISSLVIMLIWTTVAISMKYNFVEMKKLRLQQEANRIITEIQQYHRQCEAYELTANHQEIQIKHCVVNGVDQGAKQIANDFYYAIYVDTDLELGENKLYPIDAKGINASYDLTLMVSDPAKQNPKVTIDSKISRYQSN